MPINIIYERIGFCGYPIQANGYRKNHHYRLNVIMATMMALKEKTENNLTAERFFLYVPEVFNVFIAIDHIKKVLSIFKDQANKDGYVTEFIWCAQLYASEQPEGSGRKFYCFDVGVLLDKRQKFSEELRPRIEEVIAAVDKVKLAFYVPQQCDYDQNLADINCAAGSGGHQFYWLSGLAKNNPVPRKAMNRDFGFSMDCRRQYHEIASRQRLYDIRMFYDEPEGMVMEDLSPEELSRALEPFGYQFEYPL